MTPPRYVNTRATRALPVPPRLTIGLVALLIVTSVGGLPRPVGARVAAVQESPSVAGTNELAFGGYGYADRTLTAPFGLISYWLPVAPNIIPLDGSQLHLRYRASPGLRGDTSAMTILINGTPAMSVALGGERAADEAQLLTVPLPQMTQNESGRDGFTITIQATLRTTADGCEPTFAADRWLTILADSALALTVRPPRATALADLPALFIPPVGTIGEITAPPVMEPVTIVLSSAASTEEIEAAGLVALAVGQWAGRSGITPAITFAQEIPAIGPTIVVASGTHLAPGVSWGAVSWNGERYFTADGELPRDAGILSLQPGMAPRLLVTGATRFAVREAARWVLDTHLLSLLNSSYVILARGVTTPPDAALAPWRNEDTTFQELAAGDQSLIGAGTHTLRYHWARPADWVVTDGAELGLVISTGPAIGAASAVTARLNGRDLGTAQLVAEAPSEGEQAVQREIRFPIPADVVNTGAHGTPIRNLDLELEVRLVPTDAACVSPSDIPFMTLLGQSQWILPHNTDDTYDLARFPAPLYGDDEPLDTARGLIAVVPDDPQAGEIAEGLNIMAAMGRWAPYQQAQPPRLLTHRWLSTSDRAVADLILIGSRERNPSTDEFFRRRPSLAPELLQARATTQPGNGWAPLVLTDSPWAAGDAAVLVVPIVTANAQSPLTSILGRADGITQVQGAVVLVAPGAPPEAVQSATTQPKVGAGGLLPSNGSAAVNLLWVVLIMLLTLAGYRVVRTSGTRRRASRLARSTPGTGPDET